MICTNFLRQQQVRIVSTSSTNSATPNESDDASSSGDSDDCTVELGLYDVVCGRHRTAFNNIGNRRFRVTVSLALERYTSAPTRKDKSIVIKSIAALVQSNGGRFLQRQGGAWVELNEKQSHEKVGHALRDMAIASTKSVSSSRAKAMKSTFGPSSTASGIAPSARPAVEYLAELAFESSAIKLSDNEMMVEDDHSLALPHVEDQQAVGVTAEVEADVVPWRSLLEASRRASVDANILAWLVDESDLVLDIVEL
jgi:hypothetical protein